MFSKKLIIYLRRNSLEVYRENAEGYLGRLEFTVDTAKDEEVINQAKFEETIFTFLNKLALKENKAIIVLSDDVLFQKTLPLSTGEEEQKQIDKFFEEVPFDPQKIAKKAIETKNAINLFATNRLLYESCANALSKLQKQTGAVVPAPMLGVTQGVQALTKEDINKIGNSNLVDASNFLTQEAVPKAKNDSGEPAGLEPQAAELEAGGQSSSGSNFLLIAGVAFIIIGSTVAIFLYKKPDLSTLKLKSPFAKQNQVQTSPSPSPPESPQSESAVKKEDLTVEILNGTGKSGQASQVKSSLEDIGFSKIETGNASNQGHEETLVDFSQKVPNEIRGEIVSKLEETFAKIKMNIDQNQNFDIIVTTGSEK